MDSWSRGGKPREGLATSKPPSFHFTVGISITGFFGLFTWNKQLLCHEQLRATAHQLIEHRTQGMASRKKRDTMIAPSAAYNKKTDTDNFMYFKSV